MNVDNMFAQHTPTPEQKRRMNSLRNLAHGCLLAKSEAQLPVVPTRLLPFVMPKTL
jgi:hypothetical protein